jgi:hypothetical protein
MKACFDGFITFLRIRPQNPEALEVEQEAKKLHSRYLSKESRKHSRKNLEYNNEISLFQLFFSKPNQKMMEKYIDKINIDKYEPLTSKLNDQLEISE